MPYVIAYDPSRCVGCGGCAVACVDQNDMPIAAGAQSYRRVGSIERVINGQLSLQYYTSACAHCPDAPCATSCPKGCFSRDMETGFVILNPQHCIGCKRCVRACPHHAITLFEKKAHKCNGCYIRVKHQLEPACVRGCITGALKLYTLEAYEQEVAHGKVLRIADPCCETQPDALVHTDI